VALVDFLLVSWFFCICSMFLLGLLIVKCLFDYTYLSRQTYNPFVSILNYFFLSNACLILYFCFVCSSAHMFAFCVFSLLTTKLSIWFQTRGRHQKQINALCPSFTSLRPIMFKLCMLLLMPMMITTTC
jgi:hypothetical protein